LTSFNPVEKLLLATGWYPSPLLLGFWGMSSSRVLMAGVELGVFELLAAGEKAAKDVAAELHTDPVGTEALLNALNGFGYLKRRRGRYSNGRAVRRWLHSGARFPLDGAFGLFRILWNEMSGLEDRLREGGARDFHAERDERFWSDYETGLAQFARLGSLEIVRKVKPDVHPERLLDVGGGHGTYSMRFCERYPALRATVLDLPGACEFGRTNVEAAGLSDRVTFREGDLLSEQWGDGYDILLLFNVVHVFSPEQVARIFGKARSALRAGGTFAVLDSAHAGSSGDIDTAGGANELLFWVINNTRAYPEESVVAWMREAGFGDVRARHLAVVPQATLTVGRVPA